MRVLALALVALGACWPATADPPEEAGVREHFAAFARAFAQGDARAVAESFAEDADLQRPNQPPVVGRPAIEAFYARMFAGPLAGVTKTTAVDRVRLLRPELAVVDSSYTLDRATPLLHARGVSLTLLEKRDGRWLAVLSRSYRLPPEARAQGQ